MKTVILAGGKGTRLAEETIRIPKPLVTVGEKPILWHIMKIYSYWGYNEFVIAVGYLGNKIKEYFLNLPYYDSNFTISTKSNSIEFHSHTVDNWKVTIVDTGLDTQTGGRLARLSPYLDDIFMCTYGDGVANINIPNLLQHYKNSGYKYMLTGVRKPSRYGDLAVENNTVTKFSEKTSLSWINGGFYVFSKDILKYCIDDSVQLERDILSILAQQEKLGIYYHPDFFQCMDTVRDRQFLETLWKQNSPWKLW